MAAIMDTSAIGEPPLVSAPGGVPTVALSLSSFKDHRTPSSHTHGSSHHLPLSLGLVPAPLTIRSTAIHHDRDDALPSASRHQRNNSGGNNGTRTTPITPTTEHKHDYNTIVTPLSLSSIMDQGDIKRSATSTPPPPLSPMPSLSSSASSSDTKTNRSVITTGVVVARPTSARSDDGIIEEIVTDDIEASLEEEYFDQYYDASRNPSTPRVATMPIPVPMVSSLSSSTNGNTTPRRASTPINRSTPPPLTRPSSAAVVAAVAAGLDPYSLHERWPNEALSASIAVVNQVISGTPPATAAANVIATVTPSSINNNATNNASLRARTPPTVTRGLSPTRVMNVVPTSLIGVASSINDAPGSPNAPVHLATHFSPSGARVTVVQRNSPMPAAAAAGSGSAPMPTTPTTSTAPPPSSSMVIIRPPTPPTNQRTFQIGSPSSISSVPPVAVVTSSSASSVSSVSTTVAAASSLSNQNVHVLSSSLLDISNNGSNEAIATPAAVTNITPMSSLPQLPTTDVLTASVSSAWPSSITSSSSPSLSTLITTAAASSNSSTSSATSTSSASSVTHISGLDDVKDILDAVTISQPISHSPALIRGGLGPLPFVSNQHRLIAEKQKAESELRQVRTDLAAARHARQRAEDELMAYRIQTENWRSESKQTAMEQGQQIAQLAKESIELRRELAEARTAANEQRVLVNRYMSLNFANVATHELKDLELHFQRGVSQLSTLIRRRMDDERESLLAEKRCLICEDRPVNTVLAPCGHHICCGTCAAQLHHCPIDRAAIASRIVTFGR